MTFIDPNRALTPVSCFNFRRFVILALCGSYPIWRTPLIEHGAATRQWYYNTTKQRSVGKLVKSILSLNSVVICGRWHSSPII